MRRRKMNRRFVWMLFLLTGMIFLWTIGVQAEGENGLHYEDADRYKIYYLEYGARLRSEWKTVNGAQYYFGADGYAYRSGIEQIGTARYAFREDGTLITSGWAEYGGIRVYIQNRMMVKGDRMIGGKWYFFDRESGAMRTGLVRTGTGYKLYGQNGIWIGDVSSSGWNEVGGDRYYIENGETLKGIRTIGQETYSFDSEGQMERDVIREDSDNRKLFGKDGKMLHGGWYQLDGNWYYIDPGTSTILSGGLYTINGKRYLLDEEGVMQKNSGTDGTTVYTIGADGAVTAAKRLSDGWTLSGGEYYYYRNGKPFTGWKGNYYVSNGKMRRNTVAPGGYYVDEGGKAKVTAGWAKIEETSGSRWVYAKKGGKLMKNSWLKIGNNWYYLGGDDGYTMLTGARKIGKKWYIFSAGGVLKKELGKALPTGWVKAGSDWYFFRNGKVLTGRYTIGGKIYSLKQSLLISGGFTDLEEGRSYYSRSDGAAQNYTGWKELGGKWFWFGKDGKAVLDNWINDKGKLYYGTENGILKGYQVVNGRLYHFDNSGLMTEICNYSNGWKRLGGNDYYFRGGVALAGQIVTDKGKNYLLDQSGKLAKNKEVNGYYANASGIVICNAWKKVDGVYRYYGADGKRLQGIRKIGGKIYYLD